LKLGIQGKVRRRRPCSTLCLSKG